MGSCIIIYVYIYMGSCIGGPEDDGEPVKLVKAFNL